MHSLLTAPLDFPLSPLTSLSSTQLALTRLHPDFEESDGLRICQLFYYKREKAQQARKRGGNQVEDEETKFALIDLDFKLDGNLEGLNEEQLAAVVLLAHPDASELHVLKAERIWRKRREKAAVSARTAPSNVEKQSKEVPAPVPRANRSELRVSTGRPITPAPSSASTVATERRPSPKRTRPSTPPPQPVVAPLPPRRRRTPRPIPPLPSVETRLPDSLCREVYPLKLSNLPLADIKTRDDVSSLFPRSLLPDAVILHRPSNPDDVSRTAYVGWVFDFEKRTEAMQEVIRVRMGRWRAMAEFVDCEKPKWEWGDLAKIKREQVWKRWNEKEQEREYEKEAEEARKQEEANAGGQTVEEEDEEEGGGYLVAPESEDPEPTTMEDIVPQAPSPVLQVQHRDAEEEPEAIVLDSPALPPIPSRAPSRAGSSRNDSTHSFQPPPPSPPRLAIPARPPPRQNPDASTSQRNLTKSVPSRRSSPRRSSPPAVERVAAPPPPTLPRDLPPHIARDQPPAPPQISTANSVPKGPRVPVQNRPSHSTAARQQPQFVDSPPPSRPQNPNPTSRPPPPAPSLLARTTEIEVRGSAPTPSSIAPTPSSASQARKPSLMDRVNGNGGTPSTASSSKSASPPVSRAHSPQTGSKNQQTSRASPGVTRGGGGGNGNSKGKGQGQGQGQTQNQGQNRSQANPNPKQQSHQQQQQQQQRGKKRGPANDFDHQNSNANPRGGGGGSSSILDRIEGTGSNGQGHGQGGGGGGRGGQPKKQRGNGNDGGGSLLSRLG